MIGLFIASNFASYFPARFRELHRYAGVTNELKEVIERQEIEKGLVFVWTEGLIYNEGFYLNDPFLEQGPIFAIDLGDQNDSLLRRYPNLPAYRWTRDHRLLRIRVTPDSGPFSQSAADPMDLHQVGGT